MNTLILPALSVSPILLHCSNTNKKEKGKERRVNEKQNALAPTFVFRMMMEKERLQSTREEHTRRRFEGRTKYDGKKDRMPWPES